MQCLNFTVRTADKQKLEYSHISIIQKLFFFIDNQLVFPRHWLRVTMRKVSGDAMPRSPFPTPDKCQKKIRDSWKKKHCSFCCKAKAANAQVLPQARRDVGDLGGA